MHRRKLIVLVFFLVYFFGLCLGRTMPVVLSGTCHDVGNGLPSNEVTEISMDGRGFVWCATNNGLSRFDGYEFVNFRSSYDNPSYFTSNTISDMAEADDKIWMVTPGGVELFDKRNCSVRHVIDTLPGHPNIKCVLPVSDSCVFIGSDSGLFRYSDISGEIVKLPSGELSNVRELYPDSMGNVWIGTWNRGVFMLTSGGNIEKIEAGGLPGDLAATGFREDGKGNMFISTWGDGLYCLDGFYLGHDRVLNYALPKADYSSLTWNIIHGMDFDSSGNLWLGSPGGLKIVSLEDDGFREIPYEIEGVGNMFHEVMSVYRDDDGIMWLSDYGRGIVSVQQYGSCIHEAGLKKFGLSSNAVTAVHEIDDGVFLLGISGEGVLCYDSRSDELRKYPALDRIDIDANAAVSFVDVPESGSLFMAMRYYGVYQVFMQDGTPVLVKHYDTEKAGVRNAFTNVAVSDTGNVWVGTRAGLVLLKKDRAGQYSVKEPAELNDVIGYADISALCVDGAGDLWVGTAEDGLYKVRFSGGRYDIVELKMYSWENKRLNSNKITTIFEDSGSGRGKRLWVGTYGGGLNLYDAAADEFRVVGDIQLFPSDVIASVAEDRKGNLWIATGNGFLCYDPESSSVIRRFGAAGGLKNLSFIENSVWSDGNDVVFGGYDGITLFNSDNMDDYAEIASPNITDILLFNKSVFSFPEERRAEIMDGYPPYSSGITLGHRDRSLSLKFSSSVYDREVSMTRYSYRLEGLEDDWNYVEGSSRVVTYNNLDPGRYRFLVRAVAESGDWTDPASLDIVIRPSPWLTWWMKIIYASAGILAGICILMVVRNRLKLREAVKIEHIERLKSEELNNAKLMFFTNISHELFTPITIMSCALEKLMEKEDSDTSLYRLIRANLERLFRMLQQILEFRKAESSNLKLKVSEIDITAFVRKICQDNFAPLESERDIRLSFNAPDGTVTGYADPDKLDKILYNLLSNAYKYNRRGGSVHVEVRPVVPDNCVASVEISVRDTGCGMSEQVKNSLFKRFYDGDYRRQNTVGTGIGLSLTKDLVTLHKGRIDVESKEGEGSEFKVVMPVDKSAYSPDEIDSGTVGEAEGPGEETVEGEVPEKSGDGVKNYTLLLVEDNAELLSVMKNMLQTKYKVLTAVDGSRAVDILEEKPVDVIVTDYVMPEMDGVELVRYVRSHVALSHLPVIMLSARSEAENRLEAYKVGIDMFVPKPFDTKLLRVQIDNLLENRNKLYERFRAGNVDEDVSPLVNTDLDRQFIEKVVKLVEERIAEPEFNIEAFNEAMNMSNSTLYRKIKGLTGMSPKELIRNIRFKYACRLLLEKTVNITDVAYMVGFSDAKYFSLSFKKKFGMTPSQYISAHRQEQEGENP